MRTAIKGLLRIICAAASLFSLLCISSCAGYLGTETRVNNLVAEGNLSEAHAFLQANKKTYGSNNRLLYFLDQGYIAHIAGDYVRSIEAFEQAKQEYDRLYTKSVSAIAASFVFNDYSLAYRGEDFERVLINIFQALNYLMLNKPDEAQVEIRDVDLKLSLINDRYKPDQKNVYKEDGFARLFSGILYETEGSGEGYNNAYIAYSKAADTYENDYHSNYGVTPPLLLKENLCAAAAYMGREEMKSCRKRFGALSFKSLDEKAAKAEVYLIQYNGFAPYKTQVSIPLVLPDGYIVPLAFPRYEIIPRLVQGSQLEAVSRNKATFVAHSELVQNIEAIAVRNLDNRKIRVMAKALASMTGKYFAEKAVEKKVRESYGRNTAEGVSILGSLYNMFTNRADLRSWQTLPSQIRMARLLLEPGIYDIKVVNFDEANQPVDEAVLGTVDLDAGAKKFFILRTAR